MKKYKKILIWIGAFFVLGFIMSMLIHSGYWASLMAGFKTIRWYLYLPYIIIAFFLVILIHELGHLLSFVFSGIKIRALYVLIFVIKKTDKGWRFQIYLPLIKILGGLVVPDLPVITSDKQYDEVVVKFSKALIAGPIASLIYFVVAITAFMLTWFLSGPTYLLGILALNAIIVTILTVLVMLASSISTDVMYGDFVAKKKIKEDKLFQMNQIIQYVSFSLNENDNYNSNNYFLNKITNYYYERPMTYQLFDKALVMQYLSLIVKDKNYSFDDKIEKRIKNYNISRLARSKDGIELAYLISCYYYCIDNVAKSYEIYFLINSNKNNHIDKEILKFYKIQYAHMLNLNDHTNYFKSLEDLYLGDLWLLKPIFNKEALLEDLLFKMKLKQYKTELYCNI